MTRPIDEKIVVMKLDNSDFARKAAQTTSLFGKLRDGLNKIPGVNLGKTTQELGSIAKETKNINMDGLRGSLETVASKFSALGVIATTALVNISNKAVNAGLTLAKSFTIEPITEGFGEYEQKLSSIQTILANTKRDGTTLEDVNKSLGELNTYADKTIYNFADMTRNIGLFTNAGLELEESTSMIKGFSNAAAASGTDSEKAAAAAFQLSQGLSQGYIMQEDWMSLTSAGMGNDNMKRDLIAIGQAAGTLKDMSPEEAIKNWKSLLSEDKWLTSDVMSTYLQSMAGDLDKATLMTKGLTEAQADMLISNAKTGEDSAIKVRKFTQLMDTLKEAVGSGWASSFEHIFGDFDEATKLWTGLSTSIGGWIDKTSQARNKWLGGIADAGGFQNIFDGIANAAKPVIQIFGALSDAFKAVFPTPSVNRVVQLTETFKKFTAGLELSKGRVEQIKTVFQGVFSIFSTVWEITKRLASAFVKLIPEGTAGGVLDFVTNIAEMAISFNESVKAGNGLTDFIDGLGSVLGKLGGIVGSTIGGFITFAGTLTDNVGKAVDWIKEKLAPLGNYLKDTFAGFGGSQILGVGLLAGIYLMFQKVTGIFDDFLDNAGSIVDNVKEVFEGVGDSLNAFISGVKYTNLMLIAIAVGILAVSLKTLEGIKAEDIAKGITSLAIALGVMIGGMMLIDKFKVTGGVRASINLIALAAAVNVMASSLKKIADINPDQLSSAISGLVAITGALALAVIAISRWGGKIGATSLQLIALSTAIYILAGAVDKMASIDTGQLFISIGALALIFAELALFLKVVDKAKFGVGSALGVLVVAGAIQVMVDAINKISESNVPELVKGLSTIAIILAEIAIFSKVVSGGNLLISSIGMMAIAGAINAMIPPIQVFANMSWEELAKGLGAMAVALLAVAGAGILATGAIGGAAAITLMALALQLLVGPIQIFANMTWMELVKGFVGLAGGLTVVAVAALLLTPAIIPMLGFGAALLIMGAAMLAAGAGVALFGAGLATLATLTAASVAAIVGALALLIQGLVTLIPQVVQFVVDFGQALISGMQALIPPLVDMVINVVMHILRALRDNLPEFISIGSDIIQRLMEGLGNELPPLIETAVGLIIDLVDGMAAAVRDNGPELIASVMGLLGEILLLVIEAGLQMINALLGWLPGVKSATAEIGKTAEEHIRSNFGATATGEDKGKDFANALSGKKGDAARAGGDVAQGAEDGADDADLSTIGKGHGLDFSDALGSVSGSAESSGLSLANAGEDGAGSISMSGTGANFGQGFAGGINSKSVLNSVVSAGKSIASAAKNAVTSWLHIKSPSRVMIKDGGWFGEGFAIGIGNKAKAVGEKAKGLAVTAKDSLNKFLNGFELPQDDNELRFKAIIDYDKLDPKQFGNMKPLPISPDTSVTRNLADSTRAAMRQNNNKNLENPVNNNSTTHNNTYDIHVSANGTMSKSAVRKLAEDIQEEIKNLNDRGRISRGEEVAF